MIGFKEFIAKALYEASFNIDQQSNASDLIAKLAAKKLSTTLYRLKTIPGLDTDTVDYKKADGTVGTGYMYVSADGYRFRVGMAQTTGTGSKRVSAELNALDLWLPTNKDFYGAPDRSVVTDPNSNIVQVLSDALDYLVSGTMPVIEESAFAPIKPLLMEDVDATDPRLATPKVRYAVQVLGIDINTFTGSSPAGWYAKLKTIPAFKEDEYQEWKAGFKKVSNKETNTMQDGAKAADKQLSDTKFADPDVIFDDLEKLTSVVASGLSNALLVIGMGGLGKTFHVEKTMNAMLGSPDGPSAKWRHYKGAKLSPLGLYTTLFVNRDNMTIVFDDSDSVFGSEDAVNMLKAAADTYKVRKLSWSSGVTQNVLKLTDAEKRELFNKIDDAYMDDPSSVGSKDLKLPSEFEFTSRFIFISNLPKSKIPQPLLSRSFVADVTLDSEGVKQRIRTILATKKDVNSDEAAEIMEKLEASGGQLTMRAVETSLALKASGIGDWLRFVQSYIAA